MPLFSYICKKHGEFEEIFLTFREAEEASEFGICPECGKLCKKEEFSMPARFMGCFGDSYGGGATQAPSKRHSYKRINKDGANEG